MPPSSDLDEEMEKATLLQNSDRALQVPQQLQPVCAYANAIRAGPTQISRMQSGPSHFLLQVWLPVESSRAVSF